MSTTQTHHMIPRAVVLAYKPFLQSIGFEVDAADNLITLPKAVSANGDAMHSGPLNSYSESVTQLVGKIGDLYAQQMSDPDPAVAAAAGNVAMANMKALQAFTRAGLQGTVDPLTGNVIPSQLVLNSGTDAAQRGIGNTQADITAAKLFPQLSNIPGSRPIRSFLTYCRCCRLRLRCQLSAICPPLPRRR